MIDVETNAGIAIVRMDHGKVNAMDLEFCRSLIDVLKQVESSDVRGAVLTGNDRVFSAGVDLIALLDGGNEYVQQFLPALVDCFKTTFRFSKPLVAAVNGHAVAGGCILATACDHRLIHDKAKIGIPELRVGVPLPAIAIEIMRFAVAPEALQAMVNIGKNYRGSEALRVGLADGMVARDELMESALKMANDLLAIPAEVFAVTKQQLRAPANRLVDQNESDFEKTVNALWHSEEIQDVIREYVAKRL